MGAAHLLFRSPVNSGVIGGLIGIMVSGAANIREYKEGKVEAADATIRVGKDAIGTGVATGISAAVAGPVGSSLLLALVVGVGVKYAWDTAMEKIEDNPPLKD